MSSEFQSQIEAAVAWIRERWNRNPRFGIILGTGAGQIAELIDADVKLAYGEIPNFPQSTALGHKGQFVCGKFANTNVIAMEGRFHLYEGWSVDKATMAIHVMQAMGVEYLFVSNASGGINPKFSSGDIMLIESHIDLMNRSTRQVTAGDTLGRPSLRCDCYDPEMIEQATRFARHNDFPIQQGVYGAMLGPNYETRAEYRFLRRVGADVAGMSTVPEVTVAGKYGMKVLGLSIVSNVANPDVLEETSGQEVIDAAAKAAPRLRAIVENAIQLASGR